MGKSKVKLIRALALQRRRRGGGGGRRRRRRRSRQLVVELETAPHTGRTPGRTTHRATDQGLWQTRDRHPALGTRPPRVHPWEEQAQLPSASRGRITPNKTTRALTRAAMSIKESRREACRRVAYCMSLHGRLHDFATIGRMARSQLRAPQYGTGSL